MASLAEDLTEKNEIFYTKKYFISKLNIRSSRCFNRTYKFCFKKRNIIPSKINTNNGSELSFSRRLSDINNDSTNIKVNFSSSWQLFTNYSLLDFFEMLESNDVKLKNLRNKIVLVGVSDPLIAKTISSNFNDRIPGIGLHAFAIENSLNSRDINFSYLNISTYIVFYYNNSFSIILQQNKNILHLVFIFSNPYIFCSSYNFILS